MMQWLLDRLTSECRHCGELRAWYVDGGMCPLCWHNEDYPPEAYDDA